jgi:hypothetical protein
MRAVRSASASWRWGLLLTKRTRWTERESAARRLTNSRGTPYTQFALTLTMSVVLLAGLALTAGPLLGVHGVASVEQHIYQNADCTGPYTVANHVDTGIKCDWYGDGTSNNIYCSPDGTHVCSYLYTTNDCNINNVYLIQIEAGLNQCGAQGVGVLKQCFNTSQGECPRIHTRSVIHGPGAHFRAGVGGADFWRVMSLSPQARLLLSVTTRSTVRTCPSTPRSSTE